MHRRIGSLSVFLGRVARQPAVFSERTPRRLGRLTGAGKAGNITNVSLLCEGQSFVYKNMGNALTRQLPRLLKNRACAEENGGCERCSCKTKKRYGFFLLFPLFVI